MKANLVTKLRHLRCYKSLIPYAKFIFYEIFLTAIKLLYRFIIATSIVLERKVAMDISAITESAIPQLIEWAQGFGPKLLLAIIIFYIGRKIVRKLSGATVTATQKFPTVDETLARFLGSLVFFLGLFAVIVASLSAMNISMGFIAGILGALVVALGFALQESLGDLASGIMLALFRPYKVGDEVEIAGEFGAVTQLDLFTTTLKTVDGLELHIGNGAAFGGTIKNYSAFEKLRIDMDFGVSYDADLDKAISAITSVAKGDKRIKNDPEGPWAKVTELGDSAVNIQLRLWCHWKDFRSIKADISQRVKTALDKAGVNIPYEHCMIIPIGGE